MKILFIGNSHTYYNSLPAVVRSIFASVGEDAEVVMMTEGGKNLLYHCRRHDVLLNIKTGGFDYVVLQEAATNFCERCMSRGAQILNDGTGGFADSRVILYMIWAHRDLPDRITEQQYISEAYRKVARQINAQTAPAGDIWTELITREPEYIGKLWRDDGNHATPLGTYLAAMTLFYTITGRSRTLCPADDDKVAAGMGLDIEDCRKISKLVCEFVRKRRKADGVI